DLPALVKATLIWWVPAFRFFLVTVFRPLPLIFTVPAALSLTVTSSALPLIAAFVIATVGGQPMTAIFVVCFITAPFWPTSSVGAPSASVHRSPFAPRTE